MSLPDASGDDSVSVPHPDALPDVLLDLVVVLANTTVRKGHKIQERVGIRC